MTVPVDMSTWLGNVLEDITPKRKLVATERVIIVMEHLHTVWRYIIIKS